MSGLFSTIPRYYALTVMQLKHCSPRHRQRNDSLRMFMIMKKMTTLSDRLALQAFARRLRALRRSYGVIIGQPDLTGASFAAKLHLLPGRYYRYEHGEVEPPMSVLADLRRLTGICLDALVAGEVPGNPRMVPTGGEVEGEVTMGDRLMYTRQVLEPHRARMASVMGVDELTWALWEGGAETPPIAKMIEFAHRCGVTLDFLYLGKTEGCGRDVIAALLEQHPDLVERLPTESGDPAPERAAANAARRRRGTGAGNTERLEAGSA